MKTNGYNVITYDIIFYIEQNEYDEDGEWVSGGDVWDFAERK